MPLKHGLLAAALTVSAATGAYAQSVAEPAPGAAISVYADGLSVIRESRAADVPAAGAGISLPGLPQSLDWSTLSVSIGGTPADSIHIRQDDLSPQSLLRRSIGREITWLVPAGDSGAEREIRGTLVNVDGGIVLKVGDRFEAMPDGRLALKELPAGMTGGLEVTAVSGATAGNHPVSLGYVAPNLAWSADYEAVLLPDESGLVLSGQYQITNGTDAGFQEAAIRLVAGETNRAQGGPRPEMMAMATMDSAASMKSAPRAAPPQPASLGDVHVYDIDGRVDLPAGETVRRVLLAPVAVPAEKIYRLSGSGLVHPGQPMRLQDGLRPEVNIRFENAEDGPLAKILPAGPVRVYGALAEDSEASPRVILGEDRLSHLPVGGDAELRLGRAFDVTAERQVVDYETTGVAEHRHLHPYRATHEITLKNGRDEAVTVEMTEHLSAQSWEITDASLTPESRDAGSAVWNITIPAKGETVLRYTVRVQP
ncbi:MAG: DUF4139 domain-containing protein [Alphaproteobacteria bacterium]|nr:DUF4139 domain-containing protein [Alphaproteobacteria bacterium]